MEKREYKIIYKKSAAISISKIAHYIERKGYPITANRFTSKLYQFGNSLADFPKKYPICRKEVWAKHNLRCAVYNKNYIFLYKLINYELVIFNVVHVLTIA